jgi:hypothetical protein
MENQTVINSHLFDLFRNAPVGSNPFSFALIDLQNQQKPVSGVLIRYALTGFSSIYAMICLCCLAILVIPFFQGEVGGAKHNWIVKKKYLPQRELPTKKKTQM